MAKFSSDLATGGADVAPVALETGGGPAPSDVTPPRVEITGGLPLNPGPTGAAKITPIGGDPVIIARPAEPPPPPPLLHVTPEPPKPGDTKAVVTTTCKDCVVTKTAEVPINAGAGVPAPTASASAVDHSTTGPPAVMAPKAPSAAGAPASKGVPKGLIYTAAVVGVLLVGLAAYSHFKRGRAR